MDRLQTMKAFVRVVREGSFAGAARALDVDQAVITRQVADLERHLGVKLLERTTRSMRLTEAGEAYLERCQDLLSDLEELEAQVSHAHQAMTGRVRIALPTLFGKTLVAQQLAGLLADFPQLSIEVAMLDRPVDPVAEAYDVVIADATYGVSASAVARPLLSVPFLLCASPRYLAARARGIPRDPEALAEHCAVGQSGPGESSPSHEHWVLTRPGGIERRVLVPIALRSNTYALSLEVVRQGAGIGRFTPRMVADDLQRGDLVQVLPDWRAGHSSFNLVYPSRRLIPRRVRHVIDALVEQGRQWNSQAQPQQQQGF